MTGLLPGPRPTSTLLAAVVSASAGFGLALLLLHHTVLTGTARRLHRAEKRVAELELEVEKVRAARRDQNRLRQETASYRTEMRRLERILPATVDSGAEAVALRDTLASVPLAASVEPPAGAVEHDLFDEYRFALTCTDATRERLLRAVALLHRSTPMRAVTETTLPLDRPGTFAARLTVSSYAAPE